MNCINPNERPAMPKLTCEPATPAHGHADPVVEEDRLPGAQAKLTPADRENMLSLFPEHADRILAASRLDHVAAEHPHMVV